MKISRLMSHSIVTLGLLGISIGGVYSTTNASAEGRTTSPDQSEALHKTASNKNNKTDSATSNAQVDITDGYLTLDAVPNFNFGNNQEAVSNSSTKLDLNDNQGTRVDEGNNQGLLRVTDHRTRSDNKWQLNASLNNFKKTDAPKQGDSADTWSIELKQNRSNNDEENEKLPNLLQPELLNKKKDSQEDNSKTVMSTSNNQNNGFGSTMVEYKNAKDATLNIPYNVKPGRYTADMNWSLTANAGSEVNEIKQ